MDFLAELAEATFPRPAYDTHPEELPMNQPIKVTPVVLPPEAPKYLWDTKENCRHSIRVICDEMGLTTELKNKVSQVLHCESNWNPKCVHPNVVNGEITSTDFGIAQINDYWHIGPHKDFPSSDFVLNNPETCVRWMCKQALAGNLKLWVCYSKGMYKSYAA